MPAVMIGKCSECACLRKAFPADLSGLYSVDEMEQAETVTVTATPPPALAPAAPAGDAKIFAAGKEKFLVKKNRIYLIICFSLFLYFKKFFSPW